MSMESEFERYDKSKRKINRLKRFVLVGSLAGVAIGGIIYNNYTHSLNYFKKQLEKNGAAITEDTEYGSIDVEGEDLTFSLANCGNIDNSISDEAKGILEDTKIPTGIIVTPECTTEYDVYKEADYALNLVSKYSVEYPVFLNIDGMFTRYINENSEINNMVNQYVAKLQANGVYVSVIGHKQFMDILDSEKRITDEVEGDAAIKYNKGLIVDKKIDHVNEEIYDVIVGEDFACCKTNFKPVINGNYNSEKLFVDSYEYVVEPGDNLSEISDRFGMNFETIRAYNYTGNTIYPGQKLNIPCKNQPPYYRGIDVSAEQGSIDWNTVGKNIDFTILRAGYTAKVSGLESPIVIDSYFHYNISECNKKNIPVGIYYTSYNYNRYTMKEEANALLRQLNDYEVSLPIYINIPDDVSFNNDETRRNMIDSIDYFCTIIKENGYTPGIYINESLEPLIPELKEKYTIWSYGGLHYNDRQKYYDMNFDYKVNKNVPIFQPTKSGDPDNVGVTENFWLGYDYADRDVINEWLENKNAKVKRFRNR